MKYILTFGTPKGDKRSVSMGTLEKGPEIIKDFAKYGYTFSQGTKLVEVPLTEEELATLKALDADATGTPTT
jgi:hypothetical protein